MTETTNQMSKLQQFIKIAKELEQPKSDRIGAPFMIERDWKVEDPGFQGFKTIEAFEAFLEKRNLDGIEPPVVNGMGNVLVSFNLRDED